MFENNTLFQNTLLRLEGLEASIEVSTPVIICNEAHRFLVVDQGSQISKKIGEEGLPDDTITINFRGSSYSFWYRSKE